MLVINDVISKDTGISLKITGNVVSMLKEGSIIPFISRYRKDVTDNLDEVGVKLISDKLEYYTELEERKVTILATIEEAGKLTPELKEKIENTVSKTELEDLYLPYKPKRRTRATIAREAGLEPLANIIYAQETLSGTKDDYASQYLSEEKGLTDIDKVLSGAADIIAEWISENAEIRENIRSDIRDNGFICSRVITGRKEEKSKFEMYYEFKEKISTIPSHRILAMRRGENEKMLIISVETEDTKIINSIEAAIVKNEKNIFLEDLKNAISDGYKRLLRPSLETELRLELKEKADAEAIKVFAENIRNLLLSSPLGNKQILAIDPGIRTGCKTVILSETGDFIYDTVLYTRNENETKNAMENVLKIIDKYGISYIAIGNGTGSKEIKGLIDKSLKEKNIDTVFTILVNESGASIYSASEIAREEFPNLDLTLRGAISIGRRLQDPLSESVKIEPKSIGVGQYQHDVDQKLLSKELDHIVSSCVNFVGVDINISGFSLLQYVSGITKKVAKNIVEYRAKNGKFSNRKELLNVSGLGNKTFEQCAGFLRIRNSTNPLDNSAVHPEHYPIVEQIAAKLNVDIKNLLNNEPLLKSVKIDDFISEKAGIHTIKDIIDELKKPGRDPRTTFQNPNFRDDINSIKDLQAGMILEGVVTNLTRFGAFIDIGVHQDGLLHVSEISNKFIADLNQVLKVGQHLKVEVKSIDADRNRITLSTKFNNTQIPAAANKSSARISDETNQRDKRKSNERLFKDNGNPFAKLLRN